MGSVHDTFLRQRTRRLLLWWNSFHLIHAITTDLFRLFICISGIFNPASPSHVLYSAFGITSTFLTFFHSVDYMDMQYFSNLHVQLGRLSKLELHHTDRRWGNVTHKGRSVRHEAAMSRKRYIDIIDLSYNLFQTVNISVLTMLMRHHRLTCGPTFMWLHTHNCQRRSQRYVD